MKKILILILAVTLAFSFIGCGSFQNKKEMKSKEEVKQEITKEEKKDNTNVKMPVKEMGKGKIEISTEVETSKGGKIPIAFVDKETQIMQIGLNVGGFDDSKLSYTFIDGKEVKKEQLGDTQTSINLKKEFLNAGKHKVEIVQFDNDKIYGKIITYKTASYEIKEK